MNPRWRQPGPSTAAGPDTAARLQPRPTLPRPHTELMGRPRRDQGSVLVLVLWVAFGLVTITLYFAHSMTFEYRAADQRAAGRAADQALEGAARYACYVLSNLGTNGAVPDLALYLREAVPVGESRFWFLGRTNNPLNAPGRLAFGLMDEGAKLNLNTTPAAVLEGLPQMTPELAAAIVDWRDEDSTVSPNGAESETYARLHPAYLCKNANFETVDELRLVFGATIELLVGEDLNRNGILDANETDWDHNNRADPGLLEYLTVYSREPNTRADGSARINVATRAAAPLASLLQTNFGTARANQILARLAAAAARSEMDFYLRSGMTAEEFGRIAGDITITNGPYIEGRINVNTAAAEVLACLPGVGTDKAPTLVSYRQANPDKLTSVAWVAEALDRAVALQAGPYLTTRSYQFTADIAALGPHGRGYRRTRFVIDTSDGTPRIVYRRDLSHLGWALGRDVRQQWVVAADGSTAAAGGIVR